MPTQISALARMRSAAQGADIEVILLPSLGATKQDCTKSLAVRLWLRVWNATGGRTTYASRNTLASQTTSWLSVLIHGNAPSVCAKPAGTKPGEF